MLQKSNLLFLTVISSLIIQTVLAGTEVLQRDEYKIETDRKIGKDGSGQRFQHLVNDYPSVNQPLSAKYMKSFAYITFKERIPQIIDGVVERLNNPEHVKETLGNEALDEVVIVKQKIQNLRNSMVTDGDILPIDVNSGLLPETSRVYNKKIEEHARNNNGNPPTWFQTEWLFAECYVYYKLRQIFYSSNSFEPYDPFMEVKTESLLASTLAVRKLAGILVQTKKQNVPIGLERKELLEFYIKCSLWGNKSDLSLSNGKAVGADDTFSSLNEMDSNILVNHLNEVNKILKNDNNIIDIILDNAGYELFNDLVLADFLIWSGIAKKVVLHGKNMPWFVSDVTELDFSALIKLLHGKLENEDILALVISWKDYQDDRKWEIECEPFWTFPSDYSKMASEAPELYKTLSQSDLVIFKGDLNYRKLMGDIYWESTTPFQVALRGFEPTNVLALRTIKADTMSGLPKGVADDLTNREMNWFITGKYALIQLLKK